MTRQSAKIAIRPIELAEANKFITAHHRHHKPVQGHRFSICAVAEGRIVGVATVGRPVARLTDHLRTLEVTRLCTDGTPNACSALYAAAARAGFALGFEKIQTFILREEDGHSLLASGWKFDGASTGSKWHRNSKRYRTDQPIEPKSRWVRVLAEPLHFSREIASPLVDPQVSLFDEVQS